MKHSILAISFLLCACASGPVHKQVINPPNATRIGPYSSAVRTGNLVFLSGSIGRDANNQLPPGTEAQTRQVLENIRNSLAAARLTPDDVVKCTVFLVDMGDFEVMNGVYGRFFTQDPPARTTVAVAALPAGARVEIECIAAIR